MCKLDKSLTRPLEINQKKEAKCQFDIANGNIYAYSCLFNGKDQMEMLTNL